MLVRRAIICSLALLLALCVSLPARAGGEFGGSGKFVGWWELGGFYGTDDSSRGEVVLFTPLMQSASTLFFLDARGKFFEEDVQEANLALGYRQMMPSGWNLGLWAGWDIRDTEENNTFHQVSFGLEALSERFDVRVNGYVPITDPKGSPGLADVFLRGNNILMVGGKEVPLYGVDGEVGVLLFGGTRGGGGLKGAPAPAKRHELRAYAGGFWFDADEALEEVAGPKGRLEYRINDVITSLPGSRLTLESELSYDEVRDTKFEIGARLRIPFGTRGSDAATRIAALTGQELRMIEGLERDTDIVTTQSKEENVFDNATNVAMDAVSFASNAAGFANAVNQGGNRLIILQDGGAQIDVSGTQGQQLQTNQTVQGGGSTINYRGARTGTVAGFRAPGSRPTLFTNDTNFSTGAISLASNTHVAGLNIRGIGDQTTSVLGNYGVFGDTNLDNIVLEQLDIRNLGDDSIRFEENASNIRIWTTHIQNVGTDAIEFEQNANNIEVYDITVIDPNFEALDFDADNNTNITIKKVTVANTNINDPSDGIEFRSNSRNIHIEDVTLINPGEEGIEFLDNNQNIVIKNVRIQNARDESIEFRSDNSNILIEGVTIRDSGFEFIEFESRNTNVVIRNAQMFNSGGAGIDFSFDNRNVTFSNVNVTNTSSAGITFNSGNRDVTFSNVNTNISSTGISFNANNTNVAFLNVTTNNNSTGINFSGGNTNISLMHVDVMNTSSAGINFASDNTATFSHVNVSQAGTDGIGFTDRNVVTFTNVNITGAGDDALRFRNDNTVDINNTTFAGTIVDDILNVNGLGNTINGANNPNNAAVGGFVCNLNGGAGAFTGSVTIGNQTFVNGAGCNP